MNIRRGAVCIAALDPVVGREISKTRPVVVVSNDMNNQYSGTVTILPITSRKPREVYPFEVFLVKGSGNLPKDSKVKADQIGALDKSRMVAVIGMLDETAMNSIDKAMRIHLELR
jgi:mRNA interferase MazF